MKFMMWDIVLLVRVACRSRVKNMRCHFKTLSGIRLVIRRLIRLNTPCCLLCRLTWRIVCARLKLLSVRLLNVVV